MKTLPTAKALKESDFADVKRQLEALFYDLIFRPVVEILAPHSKQVKQAIKGMLNAVEDPIVAALRGGRIQYSNGVFSGQFNAAVSKALNRLGAKFNRQTKLYTLAPNLVPPLVSSEAHRVQNEARALHKRVMDRLDQIEASLVSAVEQNPVDATVTIGKMQRGFDEVYGDALGTESLSQHAKDNISRLYADALKPAIMDFSSDTVRELREAVEANAKQGYRFDALVQRFQGRYDVSKSKAQFLARNETSRFTSTAREERFKDAGIVEYVWVTAGDQRVREDHKKLNGKKFRFDAPPVVDDVTGRRANPGFDYNCRCEARPILPGSSLAETRTNSAPTPQLQETH